MVKYNYYTIWIGLLAVFLCGVGFSVLNPILPFLLSEMVSKENVVKTMSYLIAIYALCIFVFSPFWGILSDKYNRKIILSICLVGTSIGYLIMALAHSIIVLIIGRIIEGIMGGVMAIIYAYFTDILPKHQRIKYFGWVSIAIGSGVILGPVISGVLSQYSYQVPLYFIFIITLLNGIMCYTIMPNNYVTDNQKNKKVNNTKIVVTVKQLLIVVLLLLLSNSALQTFIAPLTIQQLSWKIVDISLMFSLMGLFDIISQLLIMPQLIKVFKNKHMMLLSISLEILGYIILIISVLYHVDVIFWIGISCFSLGDALFGPTFNTALSHYHNQGKIQGISQSIQALARIIGPICGSLLYTSSAPLNPLFFCVLLLSIANIYIMKIKQL